MNALPISHFSPFFKSIDAFIKKFAQFFHLISPKHQKLYLISYFFYIIMINILLKYCISLVWQFWLNLFFQKLKFVCYKSFKLAIIFFEFIEFFIKFFFHFKFILLYCQYLWLYILSCFLVNIFNPFYNVIKI